MLNFFVYYVSHVQYFYWLDYSVFRLETHLLQLSCWFHLLLTYPKGHPGYDMLKVIQGKA